MQNRTESACFQASKCDRAVFVARVQVVPTPQHLARFDAAVAGCYDMQRRMQGVDVHDLSEGEAAEVYRCVHFDLYGLSFVGAEDVPWGRARRKDRDYRFVALQNAHLCSPEDVVAFEEYFSQFLAGQLTREFARGNQKTGNANFFETAV